jgi:hypothetical protein
MSTKSPTVRGRRGALVLLTLVAVLAVVAVPAAVRRTRAAADPVIAYPNLQVKIPTNNISIATPTPSTRVLDFTHITWNAGAGPLEIQPSYNASTGTATATQNLYTLTGAATWSFVRSVPIVKPMLYHPPSDYAFPFSTFALYSTGSGGGVGAPVATSPKVNFCMTGDTLVGGVPNTTATSTPAASDCGNPNGLLGISVGWGDEYSYPDTGNNIDISNLADGTYWLRAQADAFGYFAQGGTDQSVTDTQLQITGTTVKVLQQVTPAISRPVVAMTSPADGASIPGATTFTATVSDPATVTSVQFIVDGAPFGAPITTGGSTFSLPVASLPPGQHIVSAQATDSNHLIGTAPAVTITTPVAVGSIQLDQQIHVTGNNSVATPTFSTAAANEQLLAMVGADAASAGQTATVTGAGLTWTLVKRANTQLGDAEIWAATAPAKLANVSVTATLAQKNKDLTLSLVSLENTAGVGASVAGGAKTGAPKVTLTAVGAGSIAFGVGNDYDNAITRTVGPNQSLLSQWLDTTGDTYWSQYTSTPGPAVGGTITINDTAPTGDRWNLAAVEVKAAPATTGAPAVVITAPTSGQTVSGTIPVTAVPSAQGGATVKSVQLQVDNQPFGAALTVAPYTLPLDTTTLANGSHSVGAIVTDSNNAVSSATPVGFTISNAAPTFSVQITAPKEGHTVSGVVAITATVTSSNPVTSVQYMLNGLPLGVAQTTSPYTLSWDTKTANNGFNTLTAVATDSTNAQVTSPPATVNVSNIAVCFNIDVDVVAKGSGAQTTAPFTTAMGSELLLAFVGSDGPTTTKQKVTVTGGGLTWTLVSRENAAAGDAEIWQATAASTLSGATVTATPSTKGYHLYLNVVAIEGTGGIGATGAASANSGAPTVSLTTLQPQSIVFGVGNDWDNAIARTPGSNQLVLNQWIDSATGDTYWTQQATTQTGAAGSIITLNDTAPTTDRWNFTSVEVLAANTSNYTP